MSMCVCIFVFYSFRSVFSVVLRISTAISFIFYTRGDMSLDSRLTSNRKVGHNWLWIGGLSDGRNHNSIEAGQWLSFLYAADQNVITKEEAEKDTYFIGEVSGPWKKRHDVIFSLTTTRRINSTPFFFARFLSLLSSFVKMADNECIIYYIVGVGTVLVKMLCSSSK